MTSAKSLLRFVQVRRLGDDEGEAPGACTTGPREVARALDFRDDGSKEVRAALEDGDPTRLLALAAELRRALSAPGRERVAEGRALLRLATLNARLSLGALREHLRTLRRGSELTAAERERALTEAATWAVDALLLAAALKRGRGRGMDGAQRALRGLALLRLAASKAEDVCRLRALLAGQALRLPELPQPKPKADPTAERLDELLGLSRDLGRALSRTRALSPAAEPTLAELDGARFPDLSKSLSVLSQVAGKLGLEPKVKAGALAQVLGQEAAELRRTLGVSFEMIEGKTPYSIEDASLFDHPWELIPPALPVLSPEVRVLGRGDLMIIRTTHLRYEATEIAHIENVLASEVRERTHVFATSTLERFSESGSSVTETSQELETTEQSSLERAAETAASTTTSMSLGVSVSGGFGPIQAGIDIGADRSTSTSASNSTAVSYAKSVTEKAAETLRSEASYRRLVATRTEITETNLHKFDNAAGAGNIAGIYRFVDKVDLAQVYNYGDRLLLEFVVPEPAAQHVYLQQRKAAPAAPTPPKGWFLEIEELTEDNYVEKAARWDVLGLEPAPAPEIFVAAAFADPPARQFDYDKNSTDKSQPEWGYASYVGEIAVPDGYAADVAYIAVTWALTAGEEELEKTQGALIALGGQIVGIDDSGDSTRTLPLSPVAAGPVPVGISTDQRGGLTVSIRVRCQRTAAAFEAWRLATYELIRGGYLSQLETYENELRLLSVRQTYAANTPAEVNRGIERQELKRGCQTILSGQDFDLFGAVAFPEGEIPRIDRAEALVEADVIQAFEDWYEWENLVYLFYPPSWAGRERWAELAARTSNDPLHQAFLQAGAARVVVPVRPGYEHAVGHYLATAEIPLLGPKPWKRGESPYPPIDELIADALDRPGGEVAVGEPWEVVTPTSLVVLQAGPELNAAA